MLYYDSPVSKLHWKNPNFQNCIILLARHRPANTINLRWLWYEPLILLAPVDYSRYITVKYNKTFWSSSAMMRVESTSNSRPAKETPWGRALGCLFPDSKVRGANIGPIWGRQDPGGPHVGPMSFAIWVVSTFGKSDREISTLQWRHKCQWRGALMFSFIFISNKWLSKQSRRRWFETPSRSLWHHNEDLHCPCVVFDRLQNMALRWISLMTFPSMENLSCTNSIAIHLIATDFCIYATTAHCCHVMFKLL